MTVKNDVGRCVIFADSAAVIHKNGTCFVLPVVICMGEIINIIRALNNGKSDVAAVKLDKALNVVGKLNKAVHNAFVVLNSLFGGGRNGDNFTVLVYFSGNGSRHHFCNTLGFFLHFL